MSERQELVDVLYRADDKIWSCGCPYLALSDELGYITAYAVRTNPNLGLSNFARLSVKKMLRTAGFSLTYAKYIYQNLEDGRTLKEIGRSLE
tara:strand:+ start:5017 stop:5292 length:276 start_codon:yes stop_codon:yes gene_type:complete